MAISFGAEIVTGTPETVRRNDKVVAAYLGTTDGDQPLQAEVTAG
jgi:hypothetical protein